MFTFKKLTPERMVQLLIAEARASAQIEGIEIGIPDPEERVILAALTSAACNAFNEAIASLELDPQFLEVCSVELLEHAATKLAEKYAERKARGE